MVAAYFGHGTLLQIGDGAGPEVFATIPGVMSITGPGETRDTVDVTSHSSPSRYREFIAGLRDGGEVTADLNWLFDDPTQALLLDALASNDPVNFRVRYPYTVDDDMDTFAGFVTDLSGTAPIDAQVSKSLTIKITGPVTRTVAP